MMTGTVGKYRILERVGRGGMGTVYRAIDGTLEREVAIKILNSEITEPDVVKRFRAEAITLARLNHPGIATVYDLYQEHGDLYLVMEFVRGETLQRVSERSGPMPLDRAAALCLQALDALSYAHRFGIVHRDLKPSNLMLTEAGTIKVMDFGIARIVGSEHLTCDGSMMGTPAFMAPEQVRGNEIDARADLYAMGVVFYRLLTARLPFEADTAIAIAQKQLNDPPTPLKLTRPDLPLWCEAVLERALAKSPGDRFQSAEEFKTALTAAAVPVIAPSAVALSFGGVTPSDLPTYTMPTPRSIPSSGLHTRPSAPTGTPDPAARPLTPSTPLQTAGGIATDTPATPVDSRELTPPTKKTVVISGRYFVAGAGLIGLLIVILVVAVFVALRRPLSTLPGAQIASRLTSSASQTPEGQTTAAGSTAASPRAPDARSPVPQPPQSPGSQAPGGGLPASQQSQTGVTPTPGKGAPAPPAQPQPTQAAKTPAAGPPAPGAAGIAKTPPAQVSKSTAPGNTARDSGAPVTTPAQKAATDVPGDPTGTAGARLAPGRSLPPITFDKLKLLVLDGSKSRELDARIHLADGRIILIAVGDRLVASFPFEDVLTLSASRSRQPRWRNANGTDGAADLSRGAFGFLKSDRSWFAMQTKTNTFVVRANNDQIEPLMRAAADRTGVAVVRLGGK